MDKKVLKELIKYSDQYIAFLGNYLKIVAAGKTMADVEDQLERNKVKGATITYIPPIDKSFTPLCQ